MIPGVILCVTSVLVKINARAVPAAVSQKAAPKSADQLLNDLRAIEKVRQDALEKAFRHPKFMADSQMVEFLSALSLVDSLFVEYRNYYDAMNTLIHSDGNSMAAHEAMETIKKSIKRSYQLSKTVKTKSEKLYPPKTSETGQTDLLQDLFGRTLEKNNEIQAQLSTEFHSSPFTKNMKEMPHIPEISELE